MTASLPLKRHLIWSFQPTSKTLSTSVVLGMSLRKISPKYLYITQALIRIGLPLVLALALMARDPQHHGFGTMDGEFKS
jgi:hypothetical protein